MPTVILLKGWTPGPIYFVKNKVQNEFSCDIIEPHLMMPPFFNLSRSSMWFLDFNFCAMCCVVLAFLWALVKVWLQFESSERFLYLSILLCALAYWIRLMVAVVARAAIADGVEKCLKEMRRRNVVLCVGFSWGAGVLSELLTRDAGMDTRPAFVLMAPVSARASAAAMREDSAYRLHPLDSNDSIQVIHASDDPVFCPYQERWNNIPGINTTTLIDNHIFKSASSRRTIGEIVLTLFRMKAEGEEEP